MIFEIYLDGILYTRHQLDAVHVPNLASNHEEFAKKEQLWLNMVNFLKRKYRVAFSEASSWEIYAVVQASVQPHQISEGDMRAANSQIDRMIYERAKQSKVWNKVAIKRKNDDND